MFSNIRNKNNLGSVTMYAEGHKKQFQETGYFRNLYLTAKRYNPFYMPSFCTPFASEVNAVTITLYKICGNLLDCTTYEDFITLRTTPVILENTNLTPFELNNYQYVNCLDTLYDEQLENNSIYEIVVTDGFTTFESELIVIGHPTNFPTPNPQPQTAMNYALDTYIPTNEILANTDLTIDLVHTITANSYQISVFVNGIFCKLKSNSLNTVTINLPYSIDANDTIIITYNY